MKFDNKTNQAIKHTIHCLIGCGFGEVLGMIIASTLGWHKVGRLSLAIILAFTFGYYLTYRGVKKENTSTKDAIKITAATDTVSITTMELVDNTIELMIPNALMVNASQLRFWWGLALSLLIAFIITVPVNRFMISKNPNLHSH